MTVCELVQPIDIHWTDLSRVREHAGACFLRIDLRPQLQLPALPGFAPDYRQLVVPGEASDNVMVLDLDPLGVRGLIELPKGAAPWQVKCIPHSDCFCYVTYSGFGGDFTTSAARRGHVALLDYKRLQLLREIEVGAGPNGITVDRFARYAFVANIRGDSVSVLDVARHELIKEIPVGNGPAFVKLTRDGRYALVTNLCSSSVSIIDTATLSVIGEISTGDRSLTSPFPEYGPGDTTGVAISDGNIAYVTNYRSSSIVQIDLNPLYAGNPVGSADIRKFDSPIRHPFFVEVDRNNQRIIVSGGIERKFALFDGPTASHLGTFELDGANLDPGIFGEISMWMSVPDEHALCCLAPNGIAATRAQPSRNIVAKFM